MRTLEVGLGKRSYAIHIGTGLLDRIAEFVPSPGLSGRSCFVIADENTAPLYADRLLRALEAADAGKASTLVLPAGEGTKSFQRLEQVLSWLLKGGLTRDSLIFALGGGVIGDLAGFAAATALRGVDYIQIPTSLLAQVDSSVGGKTAINLPEGKNLVGAFYQPQTVLCDIETLGTLPPRELRAGYAEVVKYGLIVDSQFYDALESGLGEKALALDPEALAEIVETSCRIKANVVAADETEKTGQRALLNLGHTFGHAFEALGGYDGRLLHGEAVSIGMCLALRFSAQEGLCSADIAERVERHLSGVGLPVQVSDVPAFPEFGPDYTVDDLLVRMRMDKKADRSGLNFILSRGIGCAFLKKGVPEDRIRAFLTETLS